MRALETGGVPLVVEKDDFTARTTFSLRLLLSRPGQGLERSMLDFI